VFLQVGIDVVERPVGIDEQDVRPIQLRQVVPEHGCVLVLEALWVAVPAGFLLVPLPDPRETYFARASEDDGNNRSVRASALEGVDGLPSDIPAHVGVNDDGEIRVQELLAEAPKNGVGHPVSLLAAAPEEVEASDGLAEEVSFQARYPKVKR
jgi:hypothetical protein